MGWHGAAGARGRSGTGDSGQLRARQRGRGWVLSWGPGAEPGAGMLLVLQPPVQAASIPGAPRHPSEPGAVVQGGERPLSHPPRRDSAAALGQEPRPDASALALPPWPRSVPAGSCPPPGHKMSLAAFGGLGGGHGQGSAAPRCCPRHGARVASAAFPQEPLGRKGRVGWGLHEGKGPGRGGVRGTAALHAPHQSRPRREEALRALAPRAALGCGSLMGYKFLRRIVAC